MENTRSFQDSTPPLEGTAVERTVLSSRIEKSANLGKSHPMQAGARTRASIPGVVGLAEAMLVHPGVVEAVQQEPAPLQVEKVQAVSFALLSAAVAS